MVYLLLDNKNIAFALVYENPIEDTNYIEMKTEEEALQYLGKIWVSTEFIETLTEEEQEKLNLKCELEYVKCLLELNNNI